MIRVGLTTFFVIYVVSFLAAIFLLWVLYESGRKARHVEPMEQRG